MSIQLGLLILDSCLTLSALLSPNYQVLTLTYFIGVLLKTQSVESEDVENVGLLLVLLLVAVFASIVAAVVLEVRRCCLLFVLCSTFCAFSLRLCFISMLVQ